MHDLGTDMDLAGDSRVSDGARFGIALRMIGLLVALASAGSAHANDQLSPNGKAFAIPAPTAGSGKAATLENVRWQRSDIPVCWESFTPEDADKRLLVRDAVANAWETVSGARFTGWGQCRPADEAVRIGIGKGEWPRAIVGKGALGFRTSVWLNFNMAQHPGFTGCRLIETRCLQFTAVHEFGHVLGLIHEQDRPDTPQECTQKLSNGQASYQPRPGLVLLTAYDPRSVMNYCSTEGWDPRKPLALSSDDIQAIRVLFPPPLPVKPTGAGAAVTVAADQAAGGGAGTGAAGATTSVAVVSSTVVTGAPLQDTRVDAANPAQKPDRPVSEARVTDPESNGTDSRLPAGVSAAQQEEARKLRLPIPVLD